MNRILSETEERCKTIARHIIETGCTVREAAAFCEISKSTVHKDVARKLKYVDPELYGLVRTVLDKNKAERHLRGGDATKRKFKNQKGGR